MRLPQFYKRFPDEDSCVEFLRSLKEPLLGPCPKCGSIHYRWMKAKRSFECKGCRSRTSLTKGTVMESSKLSLYDWLHTIHLMTSIKQVLSAKEVQYQLGQKHYVPVWLMMMKLRSIMGKRDEEYTLGGDIEVDVSFFPTRTEKMCWYRQKNGAGSQTKTKVLAMVEAKSVDETINSYVSRGYSNVNFAKAMSVKKKSEKESIQKVVRHMKMFVIGGLDAKPITEIMARYADKGSRVFSDASASFVGLKDHFEGHISCVEGDDPNFVVRNILPWVHVLTGECRDGIAAIHKDVDTRFLQLYLNEYCWKFNRRMFRGSDNESDDLFERLARISMQYTSGIKWRDYPASGDACAYEEL